MLTENDFVYAILSAVAQEEHLDGLSKRKLVYKIYLYEQAGLDIHASYHLAADGLRSSQICKQLDELVNEEYIYADQKGKYFLTQHGYYALNNFLLTEAEWDKLSPLEYYLQMSPVETLHAQVVVYMIIIDSNYSPDDLIEKKDDIKRILSVLLPNFTETKFEACMLHINKYHNKLKEGI